MEDDEEADPSVEAKAPKFSFQNITDFETFTEGMDDVGGSEGEGEDDASMEEGSEEEEYGSENHDNIEETKDDECDGGVMTFSKGQDAEEVEKGKAVKNQLGLCMFTLYFDKTFTLLTLQKLAMLATTSAR